MNRLVEQLLCVARLDSVALDVSAQVDLRQVAEHHTACASICSFDPPDLTGPPSAKAIMKISQILVACRRAQSLEPDRRPKLGRADRREPVSWVDLVGDPEKEIRKGFRRLCAQRIDR
jgi:hypothetical protein